MVIDATAAGCILPPMESKTAAGRHVSTLFHSRRKTLIGVIHLLPLPGSPRWKGDWAEVLESAMADARALEQGGADAIEIENFGDVPFTKGSVGPETVACMGAVASAIRAAVGLPIGFNVLRNDARAGLGLATAYRGAFIRVNVLTGAMLTDQGIIEGDAHAVLRLRRALCPHTLILADVHVKHAVPMGSLSIEQSARDTIERGLADALIISGQGTGLATDLEDVRRVRKSCPNARLLLGSGVTVENVASFLPVADGFIVGTSLKTGGRVENPVDLKRVAAIRKAID